ncbi:DUF177 domain-containing protein [Clostridium sp. JN-1]|mgnify:CR=1 FL=1|uniref:YceD family protein n=1 Tax=Clostridium sp. JN-1 TaxID=2483110 RepID=UPI000F0B23BE|nr:DUF177 domain-containing protein [Clostridium sp. JN-1]
MKLCVSDLLEKEMFEKELHIEAVEKSLNDGSENIKLLEPIKLDGTLTKVRDIIELNGAIHTVLELTCSRCLEKFKYTVNIPVKERFTNVEKSNKDDGIIFINGDTIDITEVLENNIILMLPIKRLCKEDCRGLCQYCGTNLNYSTCNCKNDDIDPRLAKLKDMFSTD